jgi:hypothetical protein
MTLKQMVEEVLMTFPDYTETLIKIDLNRVYKDFCYKTRLLKKSANLTLTTAVRYALPSDFQELVKVQAFDSTSTELEDYRYRIENGYITFYDEYSENLTTLPTGISVITITYVYIPADLTALTGSPLILEMFHGALIEGVYEKYYRRKGLLAEHGASKQYYKEAIIEGKRVANIDGDKTINVSQQYF